MNSTPARLEVGGRSGVPELSIRGLRVERANGEQTGTILSGISLDLKLGETIGIVGESGSGKSITARAITGLLPPNLATTGEILLGAEKLGEFTESQWRGIRGSGIGLVLQDPFTMLSPTMRCGDVIVESLSSGKRRSRKSSHAEALRRLVEVGIDDESVLDRYPFQLSGGMRQRIAIAAALARDPRFLIADEPTTALDVTTQREILALLKRIQSEREMGLALITHDLRVAFAMCDRVYVLYAGSVVEVGSPADLEDSPLHPYTLGLLLSEPSVEHRVRELITIPGSVPSPDEVAGRCVFAPRCQWTDTVCESGSPRLIEIMPGRNTACLRIDEIRQAVAAAQNEMSVLCVQSTDRPPGPPIITVEDVSKDFAGPRKLVHALSGVSLDINENESVGLVGESGSGKTTLSRLLVGLERPTSGSIVIDGISVDDWSKLGRADLRRLRRTIQIVFQDPYSSLNPTRSVGWTLAEAITTHTPEAKRVAEQVRDLLAAVGLPEQYAERRPAALSGGMRQRVAIARALAVEPRILICDEAVSALDVSVQAQILNLLKELRAERGIGYLFVTHDLSIVRQISEYLYVMHRGRVVESGATDDVLSAPKHEYTLRLVRSMPRPESNWLNSDGGNSAAQPHADGASRLHASH